MPTGSASRSPGSRPRTSPTASRCCRPAKRRALSAVYAFARRIDDIGDGLLPAADKVAELERARADVTALAGGGRPGQDTAADPVLAALADAASRYPIPLAAFGELIDGCEADVRGTSYASFAELEHYCRCVAGSIGRLSLGVFGSADPGRGRVAGRFSRRRPAAHEHPQGRPRGPWHRTGLPAGRGPGAIRLHDRAGRTGRRGHDDRRSGRPGQVRGRPGTVLVRDRDGADAAARPAQRRVGWRDGRHLPAAA